MGSTVTRSSVWHCPSWSWWSVDGPLEFQSHIAKVHRPTGAVEVLDCTIILMFDFAPYGQLKSATLEIRGWLRRAVLNLDNMKASNDMPHIAYNVPFESANIRLDCVKAQTIQQSGLSQFAWPNQKWCLSLLSFVPQDSKKKGLPNHPQAVEIFVFDISNSYAQRVGWLSCNRNQNGSPGCKHDSMVFYMWLIGVDQSDVMVL